MINPSSSSGWCGDLSPSPLPKATVTAHGTVDPNDPFGGFYMLTSDYTQERLDLANLTEFFPNDPFLSEIYGCDIPCDVYPATAVQTVAALLATSTVHVTGPHKGTKTKPGGVVHTPKSTTTPPRKQTPPPKHPEAPLKTSPTDSPPKSSPSPEHTHAQEQPPLTTAPDAPAHLHATTGLEGGSDSRTGVGGYVYNGIGGHTIGHGTPPSATRLVIGGQTLLPGSTIIVSGTTLSFAASETGIYINGQFTTVPLSIGTTPFKAGGLLVTPTVAPIGATEYVINGQTLVPGSTLVVDGTTLSYAPSQTGIYVDGKFSTIPTDSASFTVGNMPVTPTAEPSFSVVPATGSAEQASPISVRLFVLLYSGILVVAVVF
jgi:hypothetical protein